MSTALALHVAHLVHDLEVEVDLGIALVEPRQERAHAILQRERRGADDHLASKPLDGRAHPLIHGRELLQERPAAFEIALAVRREGQPMDAAIEEVGAQALLEGRHHLGDRGNRDFVAARGAGQAPFLGGGDEILQGSQLVHGAPFTKSRGPVCLPAYSRATCGNLECGHLQHIRSAP
jgi:hypothetical protein